MVILSVSCVYRESPATIKQLASDACFMLKTWKESYHETRKKIEQSGRDARWEFDRKRLFERSDHIAVVCQDIHDIAQVEFYYQTVLQW